MLLQKDNESLIIIVELCLYYDSKYKHGRNTTEKSFMLPFEFLEGMKQ